MFELRHHRPLEPEVQIGDPVPARAFDEVALAEVHPAGEAHPVVHHQHLAMIAQVDVDRGRQQPGRQEARMGQALPLEQGAHVRPGVILADSVDDDPHVHRAPPGAAQSIHEGASGGVGLEDVALQEHAFTGRLDGFDHRGVRLLSVEERLDPVAVEQGAPGHRLGHAGDVAKLVVEVRERHPGSGFRPVADLVDAEPRDPAGFELSRPCRDAVHTEDQVEDRPREGKEQADRDPAEGGTGVALAQQHVRGGPDGDHRREHPRQQGAVHTGLADGA